jgi:Putative transposase
VVYAKAAFGGPLQVLSYLGRYIYRVAISNHRLLAFEHDRFTYPSPECYPARMPLKSATFKKMKIGPRSPGDQNVTMLRWVENR